jgi:hypothetical protein
MALKYILKEAYKEPRLNVFSSYKEIPSFGVSPLGDWIQDPRYLVLHRDTAPFLRTVQLNSGGTHWFCDQPENIDSMNLSFGGLNSANRALIAGELTTISETQKGLELFNAFARAIRRATKVEESFRVSPMALESYAAGFRLTCSVGSPLSYDLRIGK